MAVNLDWNDEQAGTEIGGELIAKLEKVLEIAARTEGVESGVVALTLVDDEEIRRLNREFRGIDKPTDVLSFPMLESGGDEPEIDYSDLEMETAEDRAEEEQEEFYAEEPLGDIVISIPRAKAQSEEYGHSFERELGFLFVHGFLHLLGYDHETEEEERAMTRKQESILLEAGLTR